jgi:hypothetical protein
MTENHYHYPLPGILAMLMTHKSVTKEDNVHPSFIEKASPKSIIKLLKFGIWLEFKKRQNKTLDIMKIMDEELEAYNKYFSMRKDTKANRENTLIIYTKVLLPL